MDHALDERVGHDVEQGTERYVGDDVERDSARDGEVVGGLDGGHVPAQRADRPLRDRRVRELEVRVVRAGAEIELVGRLDARSASLVRDTLQACVDAGEGDLLMHVGSLEIWDSAGLGVLVGAHRRARRAGRRVVLTEVPPRHLRLLRATKLHRLFVVEPRVA